MQATKLYGNLPTDLGLVGHNIDCDEMMFYLYLPIKTPGRVYESLESRLDKFHPIIDAVYSDCCSRGERLNTWLNKYVYLTVKTLLVSPGCLGQRPGWHSDGFLTKDINYIWYTDMPTVFYDAEGGMNPPNSHEESLKYFSKCEYFNARWVTYPSRHLLRLDETVVHKTNDTSVFTGMRTFVKISVSDNIYAHKGNSINPQLNLGVEYTDRQESRNCPATHRRK